MIIVIINRNDNIYNKNDYYIIQSTQIKLKKSNQRKID